MKRLALVITVLIGQGVLAKQYTFKGRWHTTNRRLDGNMTCIVDTLGSQRYRGRFFGVWQGVPFDYRKEFSGPPSKVAGAAIIDGAEYQWTGSIDERKFQASFDGDRYRGGFTLTREVEEHAPSFDPRLVWHQKHWWFQLKDKRWVYWNGEKWTLFSTKPQ